MASPLLVEPPPPLPRSPTEKALTLPCDLGSAEVNLQPFTLSISYEGTRKVPGTLATIAMIKENEWKATQCWVMLA